MSFLSRLLGSKPESDQPVRWSWPRVGILPLNVQADEFTVDVVDGDRHRKAIKASRRLHESISVPVYLNRESQNSDNPGAVAVMSALQERLGYLNSEDAERYAEVLDTVAGAGLRAASICRVQNGAVLRLSMAEPDEIRRRLQTARQQEL